MAMVVTLQTPYGQERSQGGVSKTGRGEMNGILQESQFNTVGTIKVKIRLPAGLRSDGESPSIANDL